MRLTWIRKLLLRVYICLHLSTSAYICLHLSTSVYICLHLSPFVYICLHLSTFVYICLHLSTFVYICLHTLLCTYLICLHTLLSHSLYYNSQKFEPLNFLDGIQFQRFYRPKFFRLRIMTVSSLSLPSLFNLILQK